MEGKGIVIILLAVIVVLVVSLAALIGFMFFGDRVSSPVPDAEKKIVVPKDDELFKIALFDDKVFYNLKADENHSAPVLQLKQITLKCYKDVKGIKDVEEKLEFYKSNIGELIGIYFRSKTLAEIKNNPDYTMIVKKELKYEINKLLTANVKEPKDIVYEVILGEMYYQ